MIRLSAGEHKLMLEKDGLEAEVESFTVTKDGKNRIQVKMIEGLIAVLRNGEQPEGTGGSSAVKPNQPPSATGGSDSQARYALTFPEATSRVEVDAPFNLDEDFTIEAWVTVGDVSSTEKPYHNQGIVSFAYQLTTALSHGRGERRDFSTTSKHDPDFQYTVIVNERTKKTVVRDQRSHIAAVFEKGELRQYVDGKQSLTTNHGPSQNPPSTATPTIVNKMTIGNGIAPNFDRFRGLIEGVRYSKGARYSADFTPRVELTKDKYTHALYRFEEGTGNTLKDSSGKGRDGKIIGVKSGSSSTVNSPKSPALETNSPQIVATNDEPGLKLSPGEGVVIDSLKDETDSLTMECWVSVDPQSNIYLIGSAPDYFLGRASKGSVTFKGVGGSGGDRYQLGLDGQALRKGELNHIAIVRDAEKSEHRFYINGQLHDRVNKTRSPTKSEFHICGRERQYGIKSGNGFQGTMDEVRISNNARYAGDKFTPQRHFEADKQTLVLYHCDEIKDGLLIDSSGKGHHGKVTGAKLVGAGGDAITEPPTVDGGAYPGEFALSFPERGGNNVEMPSLDAKVMQDLLRDKKLNLTIEFWLKRDREKISAHDLFAGWKENSVVVRSAAGADHGEGGWRGAPPVHFYGAYAPTRTLKDEANWMHVAAVLVNPKEYWLFIDGKLVDRKPGQWGWPGSSIPFRLMDRAAGMMGETRVSTIARYDKDFTPEFNFKTDKDTLALYHFDEGTGNTLKDSSGNGHDGKITGAKWVKGENTNISDPAAESDGVRWPLQPSKPEDIVWLQGLGARVTLRSGPDQEVDIKPGATPPTSPVTIVGITFNVVSGESVTDEALKRIATLTDLETLILKFLNDSRATVTKDGLQHLTSLVHLRHVSLESIVPAGSDVTFLESLPELKSLHLVYADKIDWHQNVSKLSSLRELHLHKTLPPDWKPLGRLKKLESLVLSDFGGGQRTPREAAAKEFATLAPWCRITVDNESKDRDLMIIEPTIPLPGARSGSAPPPAVAPFDAEQAKANQKAWADYLGEPVEYTNNIDMKLVVIPPGAFRMGEGDKAVDVTLTKPVHFGVHEVTQGQWKAVMKTEPWEGRKTMVQKEVRLGENIAANYLNWTEASEYCRKLTEQERKTGRLSANKEYRLPTEAEWEYACRAGTTTSYSFGDRKSEVVDHAWFRESVASVGEVHTHMVGLKPPNAWGLHDMHGNVAEWCQDWLGDKLVSGTDPVIPSDSSHKVFRGRSWNSRAQDSHSACRDWRSDNYINVLVGFRVVLSPTGQPNLVP